MDGDLCPLPAIVDLKKRYGATLLVDEAHSFGVLGRTGRGINEHFGAPAAEIDYWVGALSKAIPSNGGFVAGRAADILYLQHEAAPFFFPRPCARRRRPPPWPPWTSSTPSRGGSPRSGATPRRCGKA